MRKSRIVLNSPRLQKIKKEKHKVLKKKIFFLTLLIILILVGISFLSRWEKINISSIKISGNKVVETKMIEDLVKEQITGNYLWFFPKTNFIIYPQHKIETELKNKFKRIENVFINDKNIKTLEVILSERTALYTWCGETPLELENKDQKCYFLDKTGYLFDEAPYFSGNVYFKFFGISNINLENPLGSNFTKEDFSRLISLKETIEKLGIKPIALQVMDNGDVKILLASQSTTGENPEILFKLDSDFAKVIENLQSVLTTEPLQTDFKNKYNSLLYIDLRFGNKVYYKFK